MVVHFTDARPFQEESSFRILLREHSHMDNNLRPLIITGCADADLCAFSHLLGAPLLYHLSARCRY